MNLATVREVETLSSRAWPALEVLDMDGWRLRWSSGFSRRANSVWPRRATGAAPAEARIGAVEALYGQRGVRPRFQISPTSRPRTLPSRLAERGYLREVDTSVETASLVRLQAALTMARPEGLVVVAGGDVPDESWWDVWSTVEDLTPGERKTAEVILSRVPAPSLYALATVGGRPVAAGRAVLDHGWLGVFSMATLEDARRQGGARAVLRWLAQWGEAGGATRAYLQVEVPNRPARRLYAGLGFRPLYRYTYWSAPEPRFP